MPLGIPGSTHDTAMLKPRPEPQTQQGSTGWLRTSISQPPSSSPSAPGSPRPSSSSRPLASGPSPSRFSSGSPQAATSSSSSPRSAPAVPLSAPGTPSQHCGVGHCFCCRVSSFLHGPESCHQAGHGWHLSRLSSRQLHPALQSPDPLQLRRCVHQLHRVSTVGLAAGVQTQSCQPVSCD